MMVHCEISHFKKILGVEIKKVKTKSVNISTKVILAKCRKWPIYSINDTCTYIHTYMCNYASMVYRQMS